MRLQYWTRCRPDQKLEGMRLVTLASGSGTVAQRSMIIPGQTTISPPRDCPSRPASLISPLLGDLCRRSQRRVVSRPQRPLPAYTQVRRLFVGSCAYPLRTFGLADSMASV